MNVGMAQTNGLNVGMAQNDGGTPPVTEATGYMTCNKGFWTVTFLMLRMLFK